MPYHSPRTEKRVARYETHVYLLNNYLDVNPSLCCNMAHMKILVVDDEKKIADVLSQRLALRGFDATPVYDGRTALLLLRSDSFDGMILDLRLPDIDGIEVLRKTMETLPHLRVVILSGHADEQDFKTCLQLGAIACFNKPGKISELEAALTQKSEKKDESN